jgi:hypothetical protein
MDVKREVIVVHLQLMEVTYNAWYGIGRHSFQCKIQGSSAYHYLVEKHGPMNLCVLNI